MPDTVELSLFQRLSLQTGIMCCNEMGQLYEALEDLLGVKVWTHEIPGIMRSGAVDAALLVHDHGGEYALARVESPVDTAAALTGGEVVAVQTGGGDDA